MQLTLGTRNSGFQIVKVKHNNPWLNWENTHDIPVISLETGANCSENT